MCICSFSSWNYQGSFNPFLKIKMYKKKKSVNTYLLCAQFFNNLECTLLILDLKFSVGIC